MHFSRETPKKGIIMARHMNGVDMAALGETLGEMKKDPELGQCQFRVHNQWTERSRTVSRIRTFYGAKQEMEHPKTHEVATDEPAIIGGSDTAASPVETLLAALASCVTTSMLAHAAVQGIKIDAVESEIEGDMDLNGFAGLSDAPKGFQEIRVRLTVESDADPEQLRRFAEFSPTLDTIRRGARVDLRVDKGRGLRKIAPKHAAQPRPAH
jgi:uncharacterized OsmC-like protein